MSEGNREVQFAKSLEQIRKLARSQGGQLTPAQVEETFRDLNLEKAQLEMVYSYLDAHHVKVEEKLTDVSEAIASGEDLTDEELSDEERNYLDLYLEELDALPVLTDGQKKACTMNAMNGDKMAQQQLIGAYLSSVAQIARLYAGQGVLMEDLIGEGNVALTMGVTMLDSQERPEECEGMLTKMIMDAMEELIKENSDSADIEKKALDRVNRISDKADALSEELGRKVTVAELAAEEKISEKSIRDAIRISGFAIDAIDLSGETGSEDT